MEFGTHNPEFWLTLGYHAYMFGPISVAAIIAETNPPFLFCRRCVKLCASATRGHQKSRLMRCASTPEYRPDCQGIDPTDPRRQLAQQGTGSCRRTATAPARNLASAAKLPLP